MTDLEMKVIKKIMTDPAAMEKTVDFLCRLDAGESVKSIMASYGIEWEEAQT